MTKNPSVTCFSRFRISDYWPEFGQKGKETTTVADLMRHEVTNISLNSIFYDRSDFWRAKIFKNFFPTVASLRLLWSLIQYFWRPDYPMLGQWEQRTVSGRTSNKTRSNFQKNKRSNLQKNKVKPLKEEKVKHQSKQGQTLKRIRLKITRTPRWERS